jgi:hypothetical protein
MAAVYVNNLIVNAGTDFKQSFTLEGSTSNSPLNLTGYSLSSQMRKWSGSSTSVSFAATVTNPPTSGQIIISLTSEQTNNIKPGRYIYDVVIVANDQVKIRVIEGMVLVREGVTR